MEKEQKRKKLRIIETLMFIGYNFIWVIMLPILFIFSLINPQYRKYILSKFTFKLPPKQEKSIWIHCVSGGESAIGSELAKILLRETKYNIVLTSHTSDGIEMAKKRLGSLPVTITYIPYDFVFFIKRFSKRISNSILILIEVEIWPSLILYSFLKGNKVILVNGRVYNKDFNNYQSFKWFFKPILEKYSLFLAQSNDDFEKLKKIGSPENKIENVGNIKFDIQVPVNQDEKVRVLKGSIKDYPLYKIIAFSSTHSGEEELFLNAYIELKKAFNNLKIILAPRNLNRIEEVKKLIIEKNIDFTSYSLNLFHDKELILIDTYGDLISFYPLSNIVIMGGSFSKSIGCHNILEPASFGIPVLIGPFYKDFKEVIEQYINNNAIIRTPDITLESLALLLEGSLNNYEDTKKIGERGKNIVDINKGASERTVKKILDIL